MSVTTFSLTVFARAAGTDFSAPRYIRGMQGHVLAHFCKGIPRYYVREKKGIDFVCALLLLLLLTCAPHSFVHEKNLLGEEGGGGNVTTSTENLPRYTRTRTLKAGIFFPLSADELLVHYHASFPPSSSRHTTTSPPKCFRAHRPSFLTTTREDDDDDL